ncbi:hypothetical protein FrEUN1fDRAFT_2619 [Parafrankia sp. EUN1f]|nr:hypothetical protein FrEUN1fDRAFT_2619 [Parafrankia sp. EUN1f]
MVAGEIVADEVDAFGVRGIGGRPAWPLSGDDSRPR